MARMAVSSSRAFRGGSALTPPIAPRERGSATASGRTALSQKEREPDASADLLAVVTAEIHQAAGDFEALRRWLLSALRPRP